MLLAAVGPGCRDGGAPDAGPDVGRDVGADVGPDVGLDAGADAPRDTTPPDAGPDVGDATPASWVTIPAGTYTMGSPPGEPCREPAGDGGIKETQHQVTLTRKLELQSTEVTQGQFKSLMGYNPSYFLSCGVDCPVEQVTWHEAAAYCNALSDIQSHAKCYDCFGSGKITSCKDSPTYGGAKIYSCPGFRLPTEAEWEYAYRAGTTTAYHSGANDAAACKDCTKKDTNADTIGWHSANASVTYQGCVNNACGCLGTHPVAQKQKNAWNLYDMAGNVWEWCHDWFQKDLGSAAVKDPWGGASGSVRVMRGGSWLSNVQTLRAAARPHFAAPTSHYTLGFRCARTAP